jgi:hypothetical protein
VCARSRLRCSARAGICAFRQQYNYDAFVAALPPPLRALWDMVDALEFNALPNYEALRGALALQQPCVHPGGGTKRAREEAAPPPALSAADAAAAAAASAAEPVTGPEEPRGKRLRAAMAADMIGAMAREE